MSSSRRGKISQEGFTLIEVLIASVILFMSIALVSMAYKSSLRAEKSAEKHVFRMVALGFIQEAIKEDLRLRPHINSGSGTWGEFSFEWRVSEEKEKWSKAGFDLEARAEVQLGRKMFLKTIAVNLGAVEHEFTMLTWQ